MTENGMPVITVDSFLRLGRHLYEVVEVFAEEVRVRNCRTLYDSYLSWPEVESATIIQVDPVTVPEEWVA